MEVHLHMGNHRLWDNSNITALITTGINSNEHACVRILHLLGADISTTFIPPSKQDLAT